jgi:xylulokinase
MSRFLLGLDIGSSSIKASIVDSETGKSVVAAQSPAEELGMIAVNPGWAEQDPEIWWEHAKISIAKCLQHPAVSGKQIGAIGVSYQMHGLVVVGKDSRPLRPSIIWCDSRAVGIGEKANQALGADYSLKHFLNSPGNFTASKLRWIKENEPAVFGKIHKFMLPGDYIALKMTGEAVTTDSGLSEGILWDYERRSIASALVEHYGIDRSTFSEVKSVFSVQGKIRKDVADELGISGEAVISYRAGDQPNNAFSLNVLNAGETAATAGTSGVIYAVTEKNAFDARSRVNTFIHVNNKPDRISNGVLLCINGTGILNSWLRRTLKTGDSYDYDKMNAVSATAPIGCEGLSILPFGNGAERVLENKTINASFHGLDFNRHQQSHVLRAGQEGIVFALRYGFDVLQSMQLKTSVIRAGYANMFLSPLFREAFVNTIGAPLQLFNTDGATGAAIGAGIGAGIFDVTNAFKGLTLISEEKPDRHKQDQYNEAYQRWKNILEQKLSEINN